MSVAGIDVDLWTFDIARFDFLLQILSVVAGRRIWWRQGAMIDLDIDVTGLDQRFDLIERLGRDVGR